MYLELPDGTESQTLTDSTGAFQFTGLLAGTYAVSLEIAGAQAYQTVVVAGLDQTANIGLQGSFAQSIQGELQTAAGAPVSGGSVTLFWNGQSIASTAVTPKAHIRSCCPNREPMSFRPLQAA